MGSPDAELVDVELDGSYCQVMGDNLKFNKALTVNTPRAYIGFYIASLQDSLVVHQFLIIALFGDPISIPGPG